MIAVTIDEQVVVEMGERDALELAAFLGRMPHGTFYSLFHRLVDALEQKHGVEWKVLVKREGVDVVADELMERVERMVEE